MKTLRFKTDYLASCPNTQQAIYDLSDFTRFLTLTEVKKGSSLEERDLDFGFDLLKPLSDGTLFFGHLDSTSQLRVVVSLREAVKRKLRSMKKEAEEVADKYKEQLTEKEHKFDEVVETLAYTKASLDITEQQLEAAKQEIEELKAKLAQYEAK